MKYDVISALTGASKDWEIHELSLYPNQQKLIDAILDALNTDKRVVASAPTGAGKTIMAVALAKHFIQKGRRVWFLVDRIVLADQAFAAFAKYGIDPGFLQSSFEHELHDAEAVVATYQSLSNRVERYPNLISDKDVLIVDEAHILSRFHRDLLRTPNRVAIGLTATPEHQSLGLYYDRLVVHPETTMPALVEAGRLCRLRSFAPVSIDESELVYSKMRGDYTESSSHAVMRHLSADVVNSYKDYGEGKPAICFAANIRHADELALEFNQSGIKTEVVTSRTPQMDRPEIYERLASGETKVVVSVLALTTGFDLPEATVCILARPSCSETVLVQAAGRVLRTHPDKPYAILLDCGGILERLGLPTGYVPTNLRTEPPPKPSRNTKTEVAAVVCPECKSAMQPGVETCGECGHKRIFTGGVEVMDGVLVEITMEGEQRRRAAREAEERQRQRHLDSAQDFLNGVEYVRLKKGYREGWTATQFKKKFGRWPTRLESDRILPSEDPVVSKWLHNQTLRYIIGQQKARQKRAS